MFVFNDIYLGLNLDSKLHWSSHINSLTKFTARWSNFFKSVSNVWWGSQPSTLLFIYKFIVCSKLNYSCFFVVSSAPSHYNKFNKLKISCLKNILEVLKSTSSPRIEVETCCQLLDIVVRFLLKIFLYNDPSVFNSLDVFLSWRYVPKSIPVLASTAHSLATTRNYILKTHK